MVLRLLKKMNMATFEYQPSYGELAVLQTMFEEEAQNVNFENDEQRSDAYMDFVQQYIENQDEDPHIRLS